MLILAFLSTLVAMKGFKNEVTLRDLQAVIRLKEERIVIGNTDQLHFDAPAFH